jgi:hypothetical protein
MDISSMKSMNAWLSEVLHEEAIGIAAWSSDGLKTDKDTAYRCYFDWCKNQREYRAHAKNSWVREIKRIFGSLVDTEHRELRDARYLKFATLETCRAAFQSYAGSPAKLGGADTLAQVRPAERPHHPPPLPSPWRPPSCALPDQGSARDCEPAGGGDETCAPVTEAVAVGG